MPIGEVELGNLLGDAQLMATYAARVGKLNDHTLLDAIETAELTSKPGPARSKAAYDLVAAMDSLAKAIAPVTVFDLGSRWRPFPHQKHDIFSRSIFAGLAFVLIVFLGYATFVYGQARAVSDQLAAIQSQDFTAKSAHFYRHWLKVRDTFPKAAESPDESIDEYLKEFDDLRRLQGRLNEYTGDAREVFHRSSFIPLLAK
ncbi:MAG: hypothetical protein ACJ798_06655, partial [Phenylobacterium sp.]